MEGLSILIVNYYSEMYIDPLVRMVTVDISFDNYEVIIISNSLLDTVKHYHEKVKFIQNDENYGFGTAMNIGVTHSMYDYLCIINPDMEIYKGTIDKLFSYMKIINNDIGAISCLVENSDGSLQKTFFLKKH